MEYQYFATVLYVKLLRICFHVSVPESLCAMQEPQQSLPDDDELKKEVLAVLENVDVQEFNIKMLMNSLSKPLPSFKLLSDCAYTNVIILHCCCSKHAGACDSKLALYKPTCKAEGLERVLCRYQVQSGPEGQEAHDQGNCHSVLCTAGLTERVKACQ